MMSVVSFFKACVVPAVLLLFSTGTTVYAQSERATPAVVHITPNDETGTSQATVVDDAPLAFTDQLYPFDRCGRLVGASDAEHQIDQVLHNLEAALDAAGTDLDALVRLHVYLAEDDLSDVVLQRLAAMFPDRARPAITFVSGRSTRPGVRVSMDAVAVAPAASVDGRTSRYRIDGRDGHEGRAHAAVLAPGRKLFVAGQAEMGDDLPGATHATMRSLLATLAYAGATAADVVQIKAFIHPAEDAKAVEAEIARFFRGQQVPPVTTLEWRHARFPTEIELVASAPTDPYAEEAVGYYAPPWLSQATTFSRLVDVHRGGLLFTSGLYGEEDGGEAQARAIFDALGRLLDEAGSDYDHLVKGTYYPATEEGRQGLLDVRTDFYNPERPPAASLAEVGGAGRSGRALNVDMISVIPE